MFRVYLNPKSMYNNSPKLVIMVIRAIILHTFGVHVGFRVEGSGLMGSFV